MAKLGLDFYRCDTNRYQDIRIKRLKKTFGCNGIAIYDYILAEIYRVKGSFIKWDESTVFDAADYFVLKETLVKEIVNYCCHVGLFDKELLTNRSVLSSLSIQKRYIEMCRAAKRTNYEIPEMYIIHEESENLTEESANLTEETKKIHVDSDKVKYSKVKKKEIIEEIPKNSISVIEQPYLINDAIAFTIKPYVAQNEEFKKLFTEKQYTDYQWFINFLTSNTELFAKLFISKFQVTFHQYNTVLSGYSTEEITEGIKLLLGYEIKPDHSLVWKINQYIGYHSKSNNRNLGRKNANTSNFKPVTNAANYTTDHSDYQSSYGQTRRRGSNEFPKS